jgi:CDP-diglyceride synthetase
MTLFALAISIHVVTAILGLGQVAAIVVLASSTPSGACADAGSWTALDRLVLGTRWSIAIVLLSGVLLEYASGGAFHERWWFILSFFGVLVLGAINGIMGRRLKKRESAGDQRTLKSVARSAWIMCALTAAIAVLMEVKPW